jgi:multicomponent Na+:H+ antiporter subunit E
VLLATLVSLLPGTLAARLEGRQLVVHSLADPTAAEKEIAALEEHIARLLGENEQGLPR